MGGVRDGEGDYPGDLSSPSHKLNPGDQDNMERYMDVYRNTTDDPPAMWTSLYRNTSDDPAYELTPAYHEFYAKRSSDHPPSWMRNVNEVDMKAALRKNKHLFSREDQSKMNL